MVKLEWGSKRTCLGCGARFYDMRKSPITCPKCGTVLELTTTTRSRRGRAAAKEIIPSLDEIELVDDITLVDDLDDDIETDVTIEDDDMDDDIEVIPGLNDDEE